MVNGLHICIQNTTIKPLAVGSSGAGEGEGGMMVVAI
jgi:hypothetical protein